MPPWPFKLKYLCVKLLSSPNLFSSFFLPIPVRGPTFHSIAKTKNLGVVQALPVPTEYAEWRKVWVLDLSSVHISADSVLCLSLRLQTHLPLAWPLHHPYPLGHSQQSQPRLSAAHVPLIIPYCFIDIYKTLHNLASVSCCGLIFVFLHPEILWFRQTEKWNAP